MSLVHTHVALLACAAMATSGVLHAQARATAPRELRSNQKLDKQPAVLDEVSRARKIAEMEAWLLRLVGQFRVDGKHDAAVVGRAVHGHANCIAIGDGPGVRCAIGYPNSVSVPIPALPISADVNSSDEIVLPLMFFGINPGTLEIELVWIRDQVEVRSGSLVGDTVSFSADNWKGCDPVLTLCLTGGEITSTPDSDVLMKFKTYHAIPIPQKLIRIFNAYDLRLRRELSNAEMPQNSR